jgi:hypothetical protein
MSKTYETIPLFSAVDYDAAFPKVVATTPVQAAVVERTSKQVIALINDELQKIALGTSKLTPHAVQVRQGSTPFISALKTFEVDPKVLQAVHLVAVARQDFGTPFGDFVESLVTSLFKGK